MRLPKASELYPVMSDYKTLHLTRLLSSHPIEILVKQKFNNTKVK